MSKDKKKKKAGKAARASATLRSLSKNPMVADVVAAALVATASALKDSKRARQLALDTGDELRKLAKKGSEDGSALWEMALQIGRRSLEALVSDGASAAKPKAKTKAKAKAKAKAKPAGKKPAAKKAAVKKPATRKSAARKSGTKSPPRARAR
jgi:hypothetical protein